MSLLLDIIETRWERKKLFSETTLYQLVPVLHYELPVADPIDRQAACKG